MLTHRLNVGPDAPEGSAKSFIKKLLSSAGNMEYKALLTEHENIMKDLFKYISEMGEDAEYDVEQIQKHARELAAKYGDPELTLVILWTIFLKENQLGPSVYTEYVEETRCPID